MLDQRQHSLGILTARHSFGPRLDVLDQPQQLRLVLCQVQLHRFDLFDFAPKARHQCIVVELACYGVR